MFTLFLYGVTFVIGSAILGFFYLRWLDGVKKWSRVIKQFAGLGFTHQAIAFLPNYIRAANFQIFFNGRVNGQNRIYRGDVSHLLHGFINNIEVTIFYYNVFENSEAAKSIRRHGTAALFRHSPDAAPALFYEEGTDYIAPGNLRAFLDQKINIYRLSLRV